MKKKFRLSMSLTAIIMMFFMMIPQSFITKAYGDDSVTKEVVLFEGSAKAAGGWDPWETAVDITDMNVKDFNEPFTMKIAYEGNSAPCVVFQSWTGGSTWAQVTSSYISNGIAYYTYDSFCDAYESKDFSTLNRVSIKPSGADITVTRVSLVPESTDKEISINYQGTAGKIANDITTGWNLGNTLDSCGDWINNYSDGSPSSFETAWSNPVTTKAMIDKVKEAGFNSVRIPVTWSQHIDDANGYKIDKAWMDRVQEVVDYVIDDGMYCIINMHHDTGESGWLRASGNSVEKNGEKFKSVWRQISDNFKDYDNHLLFEGFNEILDDKSNWNYPGKDATSSVNKLNQMFVDVVRSSGGNNGTRCLVVNTYAASADGNVLDDFVLPQDTVENSLIAQIHFYSPYAYANEWGEWTKQTAWKDNGGKGTIDGILFSIYKKFTSNNIPVIMGEFAAANKDNLADRVEYADYVAKNSKKYGIRCFWWDAGGKFEKDSKYGYYIGMSLLNRYDLTWVYPEIVKAFTEVEPEVNTVLLGDVNNDQSVDSIDCQILKQYISHNYNGEFNAKNADLNGDGKINLADLVVLRKLL